MPTPEARHERANRICLEAIRLARRDGQTAQERARIYDREVARLMQEELSPTADHSAPPFSAGGASGRRGASAIAVSSAANSSAS